MSNQNNNQHQGENNQESLAGKRFRLKNGEMMPETEYQRSVREYKEDYTLGAPLPPMENARINLEAKFLEAERVLKSPQKEKAQLQALFKNQKQLHNYFITWEEARKEDMAWKRSIEKDLREALDEQMTILQNIAEAQEAILNGETSGQGEMMNLVMGTLNEIRERVQALEASRRQKLPARDTRKKL